MELKRFMAYFLAPLWRPGERLRRLARDRRAAGHGGLALLLVGLLYTLTIHLGWRRGFGAVVEPWIRIPAEDYYYWEQFFAAPAFFLFAILFAGVARLLAAAVGGTGRFETLFGLYAVASMLPMLVTMWLPETLLIALFPESRLHPLGGFSVLPGWLDAVRQVVGGFLWPWALVLVGLREAEDLGWIRSALVSLAAFAVTGLLVVLLIR